MKCPKGSVSNGGPVATAQCRLKPDKPEPMPPVAVMSVPLSYNLNASRVRLFETSIAVALGGLLGRTWGRGLLDVGFW